MTKKLQKLVMVRQGDVLLVKTTLPKKRGVVTPSLRGHHVLAEGEATGHAHVISSQDTKLYQETATHERYLRVVRTTPLKHEEHPAIDVPPGTYKVVRQREYFPESIRTVMD